VVESVPSNEIIFAPDRNLGTFIARRTSKKVHIWEGACICHAAADPEDVREKMRGWPDAEVLSHPETPPEIWDLSHAVLGTGGMIRHVGVSRSRRFIIGTEEGMVYRLATLYPDREFVAAGNIRCVNMKKITAEKVLKSLRSMKPVVTLDPGIRKAASAAVARMTEISG